MTGKKDFLFTLNSASTLLPVTLEDDSTSYAEGVGATNATPSLPLSSVLYTPKFSFNLLYVSRLTKSLNCSVTFLS